MIFLSKQPVLNNFCKALAECGVQLSSQPKLLVFRYVAESLKIHCMALYHLEKNSVMLSVLSFHETKFNDI
jgi:hypothetical protein